MGLRFSRSARRFLDSQPNDVRSKLIDDIAWLNDHHFIFPENWRIVPFFMAPHQGKLYSDDSHWIIFYLEGEWLVVANVGPITETPHLW